MAFILCIFYWIAMFSCEDQLLQKMMQRHLLNHILLADQFDLIENHSDIAPGDYHHTFKLKISNADKLKAIKQITTASNFTKLGMPILDLLSNETNQYYGKKQVQNYETERPPC